MYKNEVFCTLQWICYISKKNSAYFYTCYQACKEIDFQTVSCNMCVSVIGNKLVFILFCYYLIIPVSSLLLKVFMQCVGMFLCLCVCECACVHVLARRYLLTRVHILHSCTHTCKYLCACVSLAVETGWLFTYGIPDGSGVGMPVSMISCCSRLFNHANHSININIMESGRSAGAEYCCWNSAQR